MNCNRSIFKHFCIFAFLLFAAQFKTLAQVPQVPRELQFADLTVRINEQARREIQSDVDALYRNPTYFKTKADRANLYMPIVERELRDAGVPTDFKYLVIQESSLIPDAVSTSKAVGFWQFKQGTAEEVFLRVDNAIDERKNIVSSTQGAALYLKKHNASFDNWMCALVSYQMGLGGAKSYFGSQFNGKKVIEVDRNSHWYFKKFLAHKVAFESQPVTLASNSGYLEEFRIQGPMTLKELAPRLGVSEAQLLEHNKWTEKGHIPGDKPYSIVVLRQGTPSQAPVLAQNQRPATPTTAVQTTVVASTATGYPKISGNTQKATQPDQIKINNIEGVLAAKTTTQEQFTEDLGLREKKFRKINDLEPEAPVQAGNYYYTKPKKTRAEADTHVVLPGQTLWAISQMYGVRLSSLMAKNRINNERELKAGMILLLKENRKRGEPIKTVSASELQRLLGIERQQVAQVANTPSTPVNSSNTSNSTNAPAANRPTTSVPTTSVPATSNRSTPVATSTPAPRVAERQTHTVQQGETLFRISQRYGVPVDDLKKWNNLPDNTIKIGQKLLVTKP
jgi:membrane-bound lytic murein transglycosylase D